MKMFIAICHLFLAALFGSVASAQPNAADTPTRYVEVNGDRIAYRSFGQGPPVVLANRMRGTLDTWDPLFLDQLAKHHTVITFDYPGIGYSSGTLPADMSMVAKFFSDFTAAIKLKRTAVLGWSWGGYMAQALLVEYPHLVSHAILLGINPPGKNQLPIQQVWLERALKPINDLGDEEILFFEPKSDASRVAARLSRDRIYARPGVVSKIPSTPEEIHLFLKVAKEFKEDEVGRREQLTRTRTPILIVCGDNDTSVPVENWYPLIGKIPRAQLIVFPESGHGPQHQHPELAAKYIADFLRYSGN